MKFTQTLVALAATFASANAYYNATTTEVGTVVVTVPCSTGTGSPAINGTGSYTIPTASPTSVVTAGAAALDSRVFLGAVAAVAAVAFTL